MGVMPEDKSGFKRFQHILQRYTAWNTNLALTFLSVKTMFVLGRES